MSDKDFVIGGAVKAVKEAGSGLRISDVWDEINWFLENADDEDWEDGYGVSIKEYDRKLRIAICNTVIDRNPVIEKEVAESVIDAIGGVYDYIYWRWTGKALADTYNQSIISTMWGVRDEICLNHPFTAEEDDEKWWWEDLCLNAKGQLMNDIVSNSTYADRCFVIKAREPMEEIVSRIVVEKYGVNESAARSILKQIDKKDENNLYENIFLTYAYLARDDESLMQKLRAGYGASVLDAVFSVLEEYASKLTDKTEEKEAASDGSAPATANESAASGSLSRLEEELQWLSDSFIRVGKEAGTEVVLCNPDFVAKKLPYDGIIIGSQGIFVVKMCDYTGQLIIDTQGSWVCRKADGTEEAQKSPVSGLMKNEKLLRSIVGEDVPIISVICMTDEKTVVKNQENSKVPIQRMESLVEFMETFSNGWQLSKESRKEYQDKIEAYIV